MFRLNTARWYPTRRGATAVGGTAPSSPANPHSVQDHHVSLLPDPSGPHRPKPRPARAHVAGGDCARPPASGSPDKLVIRGRHRNLATKPAFSTATNAIRMTPGVRRPSAARSTLATAGSSPTRAPPSRASLDRPWKTLWPERDARPRAWTFPAGKCRPPNPAESFDRPVYRSLLRITSSDVMTPRSSAECGIGSHANTCLSSLPSQKNAEAPCFCSRNGW